jgi:hypothetical protein
MGRLECGIRQFDLGLRARKNGWAKVMHGRREGGRKA